MTRDDIIRMAREQGLPETETEGVFRVNSDDLGRMLASEREACAKVAESYEPRCEVCPSGVSNAIRARGEEKSYAAQAAIVESQTQGRMQIDPTTGDVSIGTIWARGET